MLRVGIALAAGLGVAVLALSLVLSEGPATVLASGGAALEEPLAVIRPGAGLCQANETVPRGTRAIRISLGAFNGPRISVEASSKQGLITTGEHASDWDGRTVTVPVKPVDRAASSVKVCVRTDSGESVAAFGGPVASAAPTPGQSGVALEGSLKIEYLGQSRASWLSLLTTIDERMGLGRAWSGRWVSFLVVGLMLAALALASRLLIRELHE